MSADVLDERDTAAAQAGATGYLTKPIDDGKLIPVLRRYLRQLDDHTSGNPD